MPGEDLVALAAIAALALGEDGEPVQDLEEPEGSVCPIPDDSSRPTREEAQAAWDLAIEGTLSEAQLVEEAQTGGTGAGSGFESQREYREFEIVGTDDEGIIYSIESEWVLQAEGITRDGVLVPDARTGAMRGDPVWTVRTRTARPEDDESTWSDYYVVFRNDVETDVKFTGDQEEACAWVATRNDPPLQDVLRYQESEVGPTEESLAVTYPPELGRHYFRAIQTNLAGTWTIITGAQGGVSYADALGAIQARLGQTAPPGVTPTPEPQPVPPGEGTPPPSPGVPDTVGDTFEDGTPVFKPHPASLGSPTAPGKFDEFTTADKFDLAVPMSNPYEVGFEEVPGTLSTGPKEGTWLPADFRFKTMWRDHYEGHPDHDTFNLPFARLNLIKGPGASAGYDWRPEGDLVIEGDQTPAWPDEYGALEMVIQDGWRLKFDVSFVVWDEKGFDSIQFTENMTVHMEGGDSLTLDFGVPFGFADNGLPFMSLVLAGDEKFDTSPWLETYSDPDRYRYWWQMDLLKGFKRASEDDDDDGDDGGGGGDDGGGGGDDQDQNGNGSDSETDWGKVLLGVGLVAALVFGIWMARGDA